MVKLAIFYLSFIPIQPTDSFRQSLPYHLTHDIIAHVETTSLARIKNFALKNKTKIKINKTKSKNMNGNHLKSIDRLCCSCGVTGSHNCNAELIQLINGVYPNAVSVRLMGWLMVK